MVRDPFNDLHEEEEVSESEKNLSKADTESTESFMSSEITTEYMQLVQELPMEL